METVLEIFQLKIGGENFVARQILARDSFNNAIKETIRSTILSSKIHINAIFRWLSYFIINFTKGKFVFPIARQVYRDLFHYTKIDKCVCVCVLISIGICIDVNKLGYQGIYKYYTHAV